MELTDIQKLALFATLAAASMEMSDSVKLDFKPSEASKVQTKLLEFVEEHGEEKAEELLAQALVEASRVLYNGVVEGD